jgi:endoglucanase
MLPLSRIRSLFRVFVLLWFGLLAPAVASGQSVAAGRNRQLQRGANLPYLEEWWLGTPGRAYTDYIQFAKLPEKKRYLNLMATLGLRTVRIPVCFDRWASVTPPYAIDEPRNWPALDSLVRWGLAAGLTVIIDNHHGQLDRTTMTTETDRVAAIWEQVARRYANTDPDRVLFEIYNEPHDIDAPDWQRIAQTLVSRIRAVAPRHTIVVGGVDWNGLSGLARLQPLADDNIIYTFHCYDPFIFTHQQAGWVDDGKAVATGRVPFPYGSAPMPTVAPAAKGTWGEAALNEYAKTGTVAALESTLQQAADWAARTGKPVFCGEFGAYKPAADADSRCRYITTMIAKLGRMLSVSLVGFG